MATECAACGKTFGGTRAFDLHRVGSFEPDERRCLDADEMRGRGLNGAGQGPWSLPPPPRGPVPTAGVGESETQGPSGSSDTQEALFDAQEAI